MRYFPSHFELLHTATITFTQHQRFWLSMSMQSLDTNSYAHQVKLVRQHDRLRGSSEIQPPNQRNTSEQFYHATRSESYFDGQHQSWREIESVCTESSDASEICQDHSIPELNSTQFVCTFVEDISVSDCSSFKDPFHDDWRHW